MTIEVTIRFTYTIYWVLFQQDGIGFGHRSGHPGSFLRPGSAGVSPASRRGCGQDARAPRGVDTTI